MQMTVRDGMHEGCKATLALERCTRDSGIEANDLLAGLRCLGEVRR